MPDSSVDSPPTEDGGDTVAVRVAEVVGELTGCVPLAARATVRPEHVVVSLAGGLVGQCGQLGASLRARPHGLGITVGYHRLFTHRSFKTTRAVRPLLAVLGSMAVEGPVIEWVSTHRKHHSFSDQDGDPHSPHVDRRPGWRGKLRGLGHAHIGWIFRGQDMANPARYANDLCADRDLRFISRMFPLWVFGGLALPFGLGVALTGSVLGGVTGLLWGGAVRVLLLHHVTFSINSLCHYFGQRPFSTGDQSRNLAWLAPLAFGEAWHNNHHAFPTSARHGIGRGQLDPGAWFIAGLERCHLAWDIVRISPTRQDAEKRGV